MGQRSGQRGDPAPVSPASADWMAKNVHDHKTHVTEITPTSSPDAQAEGSHEARA